MFNNFKSLAVLLVFCGLMAGMFGCGANTPDAVFNRGVRAYQQADPLGASLHFENFIEKFPEDERVMTAYQALTRCYFDMKDFSHMRDVFEDMKKKFNDPQIQISCDFQIGLAYTNEGFFDKAINKFNEISDATTNPRIRIQAYDKLAGIYAHQTQAATAQNYYDQIYQIAETDIEDATEALDVKLFSLKGKASIYKASAEFEDARKIYTQTLDLVVNATGIPGLENDRQGAVLDWVKTWAEAGDFITSVTMYDRLQNNPYILKDAKPWLVIYKLNDLQSLFMQDHLARREAEGKQDSKEPEQFTEEEVALLVHENLRLVNDFPDTDFSISSRVAIAQLIRESTPEESERYFNEAIEMYEKYITDPPDPQRPLVALMQIADSYIRLEKWSGARQTVERIQKNYSQVPEAMKRTTDMMRYIESMERKKTEEALKLKDAPVEDAGKAASK